MRRLSRELESLGAFVSPASLSMWRRGLTIPAGNSHVTDALLALERILGLPPGELVLTLSAHPGEGRRRPETPATPDPQALVLAELHRQAGYDPRSRLIVDVSHVYLVGADRRPREHTIGTTVRALSDGVDSLWFSYSAEDQTMPTTVALQGCRVGRVLTARHSGMTERIDTRELLLDRPLRKGETIRVDYAVHLSYGLTDDTLPARYLRHVVSNAGCRRLQLRIEFEQAPREVVPCEWAPASAVSGALPERTTSAGNSWELDVAVPRPGAGYGWTWRWPGADEPLGAGAAP